jgi:hypothetical protein
MMLQRATIYLSVSKVTLGEQPTWHPIGEHDFTLRTGAIPEPGAFITFVYADHDVDARIDRVEPDGTLYVTESEAV